MNQDVVRLQHIRDAISRIQGYVAEGEAAFLESTLVQDAVIKNLENIGEAAKNLSSDVCDRHPNIHWSGYRGLRDVLAHAYFRTDLKIVWRTVETEIPDLKVAVDEELASPS